MGVMTDAAAVRPKSPVRGPQARRAKPARPPGWLLGEAGCDKERSRDCIKQKVVVTSVWAATPRAGIALLGFGSQVAPMVPRNLVHTSGLSF